QLVLRIRFARPPSRLDPLSLPLEPYALFGDGDFQRQLERGEFLLFDVPIVLEGCPIIGVGDLRLYPLEAAQRIEQNRQREEWKPAQNEQEQILFRPRRAQPGDQVLV